MRVQDTMSAFARSIYLHKYALRDNAGNLLETEWGQTAKRVAVNVLGALGFGPDSDEVRETAEVIAQREFLPGGRYLYASGKEFHQTNNCLLLRAEDSREGWADLLAKCALALQTGAGIGVEYSDVRPRGSRIRRTGGVASGPVELMRMINEVGRGIRQGGDRRSAIWAGLAWSHADIPEFLAAKDWNDQIRGQKAVDFNAYAPLDMTNVSVGLDDDFFAAINDESHPQHAQARTVYTETVAAMFRHGEPGFSVNLGTKRRESLRNACCEVVSEDDSDVCNLGSLNLARIESVERLREVVRIATRFLLAGTVYSHTPYERVADVRSKNRRLGLGVMGLHEWLLARGKRYQPDAGLGEWLAVYRDDSRVWADHYADLHSLSRPVAVRAIAPTGCQRPDTLVVTEDGILELGELGRADGEQWQSLGLDVAQENGQSKHATRFFVNGEADTKRITLSSGATLEATPNHQYRCLAGADYVWRRADEMQPGDLVVVALNTYNKTTEPELQSIRKWYRTENVARLPTRMSPELAEFLGLFFANGSIHAKGIRIACNAKHPEAYEHVAALGESLFGITPTMDDNGRNCMSVCFNSSMLLRWLFVNNLDKPECTQMELPAVIRCSSRESLSWFLDGYWQADGSESNSARYIDTASPKFAQQLLAVIRALGSDAALQINVSGMGTTMYRVRWVRTARRCVTKDVRARLDALGLTSCVVDVVETVEDGRSMTLDIEVPDTVTYIANGVVSHNTIGILAETTTGIEPIFCAAYQRRYLGPNNVWLYQYVVDPTAKRLVDAGVDPDSIEDATTLALDMERRLAFQAWVQEYVDMAISSTINLPPWGSAGNNADLLPMYGEILLRYLPRLRGITVYPDGARGGQPLTPVAYREAAGKEGVVYEETEERCVGGVCGV